MRSRESMEQKLIKNQINFNFSKIKRIDQSIIEKRNKLNILPEDLKQHIFNYIENGKETINRKLKQKQRSKFERLLQRYVPKHPIIIKQQPISKLPKQENKSVLNLSNRILSKTETQALELGLNYAIPHHKHKQLIIEAGMNIELCLNDFQLNETTKDNVRAGVSRILNSEIKKPDQMTTKYGWLRPIYQDLKNDNNITIVPADKGNMTVVINTEDYMHKIEEVLEDPSYTIIQNDPTLNNEREIKKLLQSLKKSKRITKAQLIYLSPNHSKIPRFYGLPKIHKPNIPMRPIVDFRNSPSYNSAHYLNKIFKPITTNFPTHIKNSYEIAKLLKDFIIPPGYEFVSFDIISLFTRVPVKETISIIERKLNITNDWKDSCSLTSFEVIKLLELTMKSNNFTWNNTIYEQTDGCPMGSPISPVFAEFFLQELEERISTLR